MRVEIFQCLREYDHLYISRRETLEKDDSFKMSFRGHLCAYGMPELIGRYLGGMERQAVEGLTFKSNPEISVGAFELIQAAGMAHYIRRQIELVDFGLISFRCEGNEITFVHDGRHQDHYDVAADQNVREKELKSYFKAVEPDLTDQREVVISDLIENVSLDRGFSIRYNTTPLLDKYFFDQILARSIHYPDYDIFADRHNFGELGFGYYRLATMYFMSCGKKHEAFCIQLHKKNPSVQFINILTITSSIDGVIETILHVINEIGPDTIEDFAPISWKQAAQIYEVISLNKSNAEQLVEPDMALPFLIEHTPGNVMKSISGASANPFVFLRRSLRVTYPRDFDSAQNDKEARFFDELNNLMLEQCPTMQVRRGIKLRVGSRTLTDLDVVMYDSDANVAYFVQLKHQDPYGSNLRTRRNRETKLLSETQKWMSAISNWTAESSVERLLSDVGFRDVSKERKAEVVTFVLSKHHAHFLKPLQRSFDFGYATWAQFKEAIEHHSDFYSAVHRLKKGAHYGGVDELLTALAFPEPTQYGDTIVKFEKIGTNT